jgi:hypothetical protein
MEFVELKITLKNFGLDTVRVETNEYMEAVIEKGKLTELHARLFEFMGPIAWPSDNPIPDDVKAIISKYGGIMKGQTLYFMKKGAKVLFAMLWPWNDGVHITLKLGKKEGGAE